MSFLPFFASILALALLFLVTHRAPDCAECGKRLPFPRKPRSLRQALRGGWTCPNCRAELNGAGEAFSKPPLSGGGAGAGTRAETGVE